MSGAENGREAIGTWFTEFQQSGILKNGRIPEWFHGIISRKVTEELLMAKPPGYFLIRVSESRIGYSLSYRAEDRCRHFMIDMLPGNRCVIVGEKLRHSSLHDLVDFHRRTPILPYNEVLTGACGQISKDDVDYAALWFPKRTLCASGTEVCPDINAQATVPEVPQSGLQHHPNASLPPVPKQRLNGNVLPVAAPILPERLYPNLETELGALTLEDVEPPLKPVPKSTPKDADALPPIPPRSHSPHRDVLGRSGGDKPKREPAGGPGRLKPPFGPQPEASGGGERSRAEPGRIRLAQCKKLFQRKKSHPEEHPYAEIKESEVGAGENSSRQRLGGEDQDRGLHATKELASEAVVESDTTAESLPLEYFNPPPFAPGF